jgi:outer membrane lipoprotein-sorting protein
MTKFTAKLRVLMGVTVMVVVAGFASGCLSTSTKTAVPPARTPALLKNATKAELIEQYNQLANSITSLNMALTIQLTAGSTYTGTIEQYHEINGFILAQKPSRIRVIGQVPVVGKNIFDMESDGETFHIFVPSKNQFLVGPASLERPSSKPIENLRPQHLLDAIFWQPIPSGTPVLLEEIAVAPASFYVLTVVRVIEEDGANNATRSGSADWQIDRKIWFGRTDLSIARIDTFQSGGKPVAIARYNGWDMFGSVRYARQILLDRPQNDYQLQLTITKLTANDDITPDRFELPQPPGTELVRVGEAPEDKRP